MQTKRLFSVVSVFIIVAPHRLWWSSNPRPGTTRC
jgi:hypothetical protein